MERALLFVVHMYKKIGKIWKSPKNKANTLGGGQKLVPYAERMEGRLAAGPIMVKQE